MVGTTNTVDLNVKQELVKTYNNMQKIKKQNEDLEKKIEEFTLYCNELVEKGEKKYDKVILNKNEEMQQLIDKKNRTLIECKKIRSDLYKIPKIVVDMFNRRRK